MSEKPPMYQQEGQVQPGLYPQATPYQPAQGQAPYPPAQGQAPYPPAQGQPQTVVVSQPQVVVAAPLRLSAHPQGMTCPHCQANIVTRITHEIGLLTWLIVGSLFIVVCWPCCLIPFCVDGCKDVVHHCPNCNRLIGTFKRLS